MKVNFEKSLPCFLGFVLLFTSVIMNFSMDYKNNLFLEFNNLLNNKQQIIYKNIIKERITIYTIGLFLGIVLGILFLIKFPNHKYKICLFLTIVISTKLFFYKVYPKSTFMLYHLTTKQQTDKWMDIYKYMSTRWSKSLILSLISYFIISYFF